MNLITIVILLNNQRKLYEQQQQSLADDTVIKSVCQRNSYTVRRDVLSFRKFKMKDKFKKHTQAFTQQLTPLPTACAISKQQCSSNANYSQHWSHVQYSASQVTSTTDTETSMRQYLYIILVHMTFKQIQNKNVSTENAIFAKLCLHFQGYNFNSIANVIYIKIRRYTIT